MTDILMTDILMTDILMTDMLMTDILMTDILMTKPTHNILVIYYISVINIGIINILS